MRARFFASFANAISFLSRLPCGISADFRASLPYFGLAGLLLSSLALSPVLLLSCFASFSAAPFALAMLFAIAWLFFEACLTGGMHWDGAADLADAWAANPARFREVLEDPRIGAFGALILILLALMQLFAASCYFYPFIASGLSLPTLALLFRLALSGFWSRLCPVFLAFHSRAFPESMLGALVCAEASIFCLLSCLAQAFLCLFVLLLLHANIGNLCLLASGQLFLVIWLRAQAEKHGGMSGDFMGAGIVASQTLFLILAMP